jgi:hypothetical protein
MSLVSDRPVRETHAVQYGFASGSEAHHVQGVVVTTVRFHATEKDLLPSIDKKGFSLWNQKLRIYSVNKRIVHEIISLHVSSLYIITVIRCEHLVGSCKTQYGTYDSDRFGRYFGL